VKIFNKKKVRLSNVHADENQNYRDGVKHQFGIGVKRDHDKALEFYEKGALEDDYLSIQKVKYSKLDQKSLIFMAIVMLLSLTFGFVFNLIWISMVIIGTVISITTIIGIQHYWHRKSLAYISNWVAFFISTILIIPVSTIIPYFNGITWIPITLMFTIGFFVFFGGILLFISDKEKYNIVVFACGLFILVLTIGALSFETPGKKFIVREVDGGVEIAAYRSSDPDVVIPTRINNQDVVSIGPSAFYGENITSIIIKDNILEIKEYAFAYARNLEYIKLPDEVLLSEGVFYGNSSLTNIDLPNNMTSIPDELFFGATKLESIDLPNTITSIGDQACA
jgi:Leucine Rich Repeat (LRR) protein